MTERIELRDSSARAVNRFGPRQASHAWIHVSHPELAYRDGRQQFHNFLRYHRQALVQRDALRRAKGKFWVAHTEPFIEVAFELATGRGV